MTVFTMNSTRNKKFKWNQWLAAYAASSVMLGSNLDVIWFDIPVRHVKAPESELVIGNCLVVVGGIIGAIIADICGRRTALLVSSIVVIPRIVMTFEIAYKLQQLIWFSTSFFSGAIYVIVPLYISEIADNNNRGHLMVLQQLLFFLGQFASHIATAVLASYDDESSQMFMHRALLVLSVLFHGIISLTYPETPEYLNQKERYQDAAKSLAVYNGIDPLGSGRYSTNRPKNLEANKEQGLRVRIKELMRFENRKSLGIIFSLIVIRYASGANRNFYVLYGMTTECLSSKTNFYLLAGFCAALSMFNILVMVTIRVLRRKLFLLSVIATSFIAAVVGVLDLTEYYCVFVGAVYTQYLAQLIFLAITFAHLGDLFSINVRSIAIVIVLVWEVLMRVEFFRIDQLIIGPSIFKGDYTPIHSHLNCASLFVAFFFVMICFPKIRSVPRSNLGIEFSKEGECVLVEKSVLHDE